MGIAATVAKRKKKNPEKFCPARRCLWRTGDGSRCPRHAIAPASPVDDGPEDNWGAW